MFYISLDVKARFKIIISNINYQIHKLTKGAIE